jgi:putative chitinase
MPNVTGILGIDRSSFLGEIRMPLPYQLIIWRKQAADRLQELITNQADTTVQSTDYHADTLVRKLANLPDRPSDRTAFQGIFPNTSLTVGRIKTANRLRQLIMSISGEQFQPQDGWVDDALRAISNFPPRPTPEPYARLFPETPLPKITAGQLRQIAAHADPDRVTALLPHLLLTMAMHRISTPLRQAHFLAQLIHESGSFNYLEEIDPGDYLEGRTDLGNTEPGDGCRFKGRGLIQITGRANYEACGQALGVDLIRNPERLRDYDLACLSAGWFWSKHSINDYADRDNVERVTRTINGGLNGFDDRKHYLESAKTILQV